MLFEKYVKSVGCKKMTKMEKNTFLKIHFLRISKNVRLDPKTYLDSQRKIKDDSHQKNLPS